MADLIFIDLEKTYFNPGFNLTSDLVYSANSECITDVICNGKLVMRGKRIDGEEEVYKKIKEISRKF